MKYQIVSYQVVYASGARDSVKLRVYEEVTDIEAYRHRLMEKYKCVGINLTYLVP
jgi:hypothetical protein